MLDALGNPRKFDQKSFFSLNRFFYIYSMKLNEEQIKFLDDRANGRWTLNEKTGLVDIEGDFYGNGIAPELVPQEMVDDLLGFGEEELKDFKGIRFGVVTGDFNCSYSNLTSLMGAPQKVVGGFYCYNNSLTILEGAPQEVGGDFDCSRNNLTSLLGAPQEVGRNFDCSHNKLTSLEGAPQEVGRCFDCHHNNLTSLEGAPQEVGSGFDCSRNNLTSLVGAPQEVGGYFDCKNNELTSLVGAPQKIGGDFYCYPNNFLIPNCILDLVIETMKDKGVNYHLALLLNKEDIDKEINKHTEKIEKLKSVFTELDKHIPKDLQDGYLLLRRVGLFD